MAPHTLDQAEGQERDRRRNGEQPLATPHRQRQSERQAAEAPGQHSGEEPCSERGDAKPVLADVGGRTDDPPVAPMSAATREAVPPAARASAR